MRVAMLQICAAIGIGLSAAPAFATETITYTYDALGRLVSATHSGTVNNGLSSSYSHDPADNRINVIVTGATNVIVVPLGGVSVIPISTIR